jgi:group II intron reverse transcriptase/maturase
MGMLYDPEELRESFERQDGRKAPGVDGVKKADYAEGLEEKLVDLSARLRRMGFRPKPVRRVYIPKGDGRYRPLGIPSFEGRLVQDRLSLVLQAIWEPEFCECSYGFRPGRSAHDALQRVADIITYEHTQWVVEADIKGFFDHVSHEHLMRFLEHRIADPNFLRTIRRFLKAGVMEDGRVEASEEGTPQGGLVSPVLANIYLHYVLDLWFEKRFKRSCKGKAHLVRYADDFIACFECEEDANRYLSEMTERLAAFDLEIEPSKTACLRFGNRANRDRRKDDNDKPTTFNFLGFTHFVGKSRRGKFLVGRKTERKRFGKKLKMLAEQLRVLRVKGGKAMVEYVALHLRGHMQYYGVSGNTRSLQVYFHQALKLLYKWLNLRSQRKSVTWEVFNARIKKVMPCPRIVHNLYLRNLWMTSAGSRMV